ncbi:MAG: (d)CMP kinase [Lachnospiraceae bacterium]|nr:(d)CMP kinase [Lachnospiraceae bacterium]
MGFNIAIDGPAGAGKSTIAKRLAKDLDFIYVDTGALYRALAYAFWNRGIAPDDEEAIAKACEDVSVALAYENGVQKVLLNGEDISAYLRQEAVGNMASSISVYPAVRQKLLSIQQEIAEQENVVMDGRDIGTCVLPNAQCKIYLTASARTRAERRYKELIERGEEGDIDVIENDIKERDHRDMTRAIAPLKQADDAVLVDSTSMTIEEVVSAIEAEVQKRK